MSVSPNLDAMLLQFLHHYKTPTLPFTVILQHMTEHFAHTSATLKTDSSFP